MRRLLRLHPDSRGFAPARIEVGIARPLANSLILSYIVIGKISEVCMPPVIRSARSDELWRHTCFEAFVRASSEAGYYEFNFAPSTQWAVYRFDGYRSGMRLAAEIGAPRIEVQSDSERYTLRATVEPGDAPWRLGLAAVIEERSGDKSYWALAHPPGKPDFHHSDGFALEIPAA